MRDEYVLMYALMYVPMHLESVIERTPVKPLT